MIKNIEDFEVYQKAIRLFENFIKEDLPFLQKSFSGRVLAGNQLRSLDSICANMEEGYERKSGKEIKIFSGCLRVQLEKQGEDIIDYISYCQKK